MDTQEVPTSTPNGIGFYVRAAGNQPGPQPATKEARMSDGIKSEGWGGDIDAGSGFIGDGGK